MPTAATIIPASEFKAHHLVPADDTARDSVFVSLIEASLAQVENETGRTLTDKTVTETFTPDYKDTAVMLFHEGIAVADAVDASYVDEDGEAQTVSCDLTRVGDMRAHIYPATGEWPDTYCDELGNRTPFTVALTLTGPDAANIPAPLKNAAILIARFLDDGGALAEIPRHGAVQVLLAPYRRVSF